MQKSGPANRVGKIYIDYLRNGRGSTTVCAGRPARARVWASRCRSRGKNWNICAAAITGPSARCTRRLDVGNAPWADYAKSAKSLTAAMKKLAAVS